MRVIFFGTPKIADDILRAFIRSPHIEVVAVVTQPDTTGGRGHGVIEPPTKTTALGNSIPCFQPEKLRGNDDFLEELKSLEADYFFVCAYGKIFPATLLELPIHMCLNIHFSLLPKYRGAAPVQYALLGGEKVSGITIQKMSEGMDEGDIVSTLDVPIETFETSGTLFEKMSELSCDFSVRTLLSLSDGQLPLVEQDHSQATYTQKITKADGHLEDFGSVMSSFYKWKGYTPWPSVYFFLDDKRVVVEQCSYVISDQSGHPGQIVELAKDQAFDLPLGISRPKHVYGLGHDDGVLIFLRLKPEGKGSMDADSFYGGYHHLFC